MKLKEAILGALSFDALRGLCRDLGLEAEAHARTKAATAHLVRCQPIPGEHLLEYVPEPHLRAVCAALGVAGTGRKATLKKRLREKYRGPSFVALDFETADYPRDSACALGLVRVENHRIVERAYYLIRPPRRRFSFSYLHGITWPDVADQPTFAELWPTLTPILAGVDFLAAHNASFDRSVLHRCCETAGLHPPELPFQCTVRLARQTWNIYPTKLNHVCDYLGITLQHHFAASDAEACALIVIAACNTAAPK